ncbi:MAG TPA: hypothetical protein VFX95_01140 [Caulobacteraceae bacterium]|nr:hypothetical protein [Caulobacteraceae bacterium]
MSNIYPEDGSQAPGVLPETDLQPASPTLKDQVGKARQRVRGEAANFASSAREKAVEVIEERQHKVTGAIGDFAGAIRRASDDLNEHNQGMAAQLLTRGADSLEGLSHTLDGKSPGEMLNAVRDFGRRHPVAFIGGAVLAGLAVGRFVRSSMPDEGYDDTVNYETSRGWEEPMGASAGALDANATSFNAEDADMTMTPEGAGASSLDESGLSTGVDTGALDQGVGGTSRTPGSTRGV